MISQEYEKALARAHQAGLVVAARVGYNKETGERVLGVTSASEGENSLHLVTVKDLILTCDCKAAQFGRYCQHRAVAHEYLVAERFAQSDKRIDRLERDVHRVALELVRLGNQRDQRYAGQDAPVMSASKPMSLFR